jgi:hypothetical protein
MCQQPATGYGNKLTAIQADQRWSVWGLGGKPAESSSPDLIPAKIGKPPLSQLLKES